MSKSRSLFYSIQADAGFTGPAATANAGGPTALFAVEQPGAWRSHSSGLHGAAIQLSGYCPSADEQVGVPLPLLHEYHNEEKPISVENHVILCYARNCHFSRWKPKSLLTSPSCSSFVRLSFTILVL